MYESREWCLLGIRGFGYGELLHFSFMSVENDEEMGDYVPVSVR